MGGNAGRVKHQFVGQIGGQLGQGTQAGNRQLHGVLLAASEATEHLVQPVAGVHHIAPCVYMVACGHQQVPACGAPQFHLYRVDIVVGIHKKAHVIVCSVQGPCHHCQYGRCRQQQGTRSSGQEAYDSFFVHLHCHFFENGHKITYFLLAEQKKGGFSFAYTEKSYTFALAFRRYGSVGRATHS